MSTDHPIVTLTTDFGCRDHYVSAMKAVMLSINPGAQLVDVSHSIPAGDIMSGSWVLSNAAFLFPPGTVHLGVVDPGVGSTRKGIVAKVNDQIFVGPDNGLFSLAFAKRDVKGYYIENPDYTREHISNTFHGRDIFSPVAAYASKGIKPEQFGPQAGKLETYKLPMPIVDQQGIEGTIIHIDAYGNLITNISRSDLSGILNKPVKIFTGNTILDKVVSTFSDVPEGEPAALIGSSDMLEIAVNQGNAEELLNARKGDPVSIVYRN